MYYAVSVTVATEQRWRLQKHNHENPGVTMRYECQRLLGNRNNLPTTKMQNSSHCNVQTRSDTVANGADGGHADWPEGLTSSPDVK